MVIKPPRQASAAAYLESVRTAVTPQRFAAAVDAIFRRAERDGDLEAFKAVAPYVIGPMRALEDASVDDTITRIIAVVERRRAMLGDRTVLEGASVAARQVTEDEIDGEYSEVKGEIDAEAEESCSGASGYSNSGAESAA